MSEHYNMLELRRLREDVIRIVKEVSEGVTAIPELLKSGEEKRARREASYGTVVAADNGCQY